MSYMMMMAPDEYYTFTGREVIPDHVTHVLIDKALKFVPASAFRQHPNIQEVICHDGVETIEEDAFYRCPSLRRVIMPGMKVVEGWAFGICSALTYIECGKLEIIGNLAFGGSFSLSGIDLSSVRIVGGRAFMNCHALTDLKFGRKLERIEDRAFYACRSLEKVTLPLRDGLITSDGIFQGCKNLHQVDLVEAVELHEIVAALQSEEWRNDMNEEINSISQILPDVSAGQRGEGDPGEKARVIRQWISAVLGKIIHYQTEHQRILDETATTLHFALPHDIVVKNVLPFLDLPPYKFEVEEEEDEDEEQSEKEDNSTTPVIHSDVPPQAIEERIYANNDDAAAAEYTVDTFRPDIDEEEEEEAEQGIIARDERTPIIPVESTSFTSPSSRQSTATIEQEQPSHEHYSAISSARLRLIAAQRSHSQSFHQLCMAQSHHTQSVQELNEAREYLRGVEKRWGAFLELPPHTFEEEDEDEEESEKEDNNCTTPVIHSDIPPQAIEERIDAKIDNAAAAEYNLETGAIAARESAGTIHENELLNIGFMPVIDEEEEEEAEQGIIARDERTPIIPVESTSFTSPVGASPSADPPSSNAPVVAETKVEEKRVEESTLFEADEEDIPQISPLRKVINGIFMLMKWASILPLALGVIYILPVFDAALVTFGQLSDVEDLPNAMSLSSEVPEHKLPVPFSCQMKFMFMELFGWILKFLAHTVVFLAQKLWQYISTHPKSFLIVILLLVGVVSIRRKRKHRAKVRELFDIVKEEAYDRLAHCDGSGGYAALHLRDDVGHAMYPSNQRERLFMSQHVWPRVIIEVRADNRVRKFRKAADGKQLEHWDLNTNSKCGWQQRKTPDKTPGKTIEAKTSSAKRDPQ